MHALVAGWFSFLQMNATAGDVLAKDVACEWLTKAGWTFDVAMALPGMPALDWKTVNPSDYDAVVFVCGPFRRNEICTGFLDRFRGVRLIGLDLSMLDPVDQWNPFDVLLERDSTRCARPDIALAARTSAVPLVGLALVHSQRQYKGRGRHDVAHAALRTLVASRPGAVVPIDTRLENNPAGLRSAAEVESVIARMDIVVTTRLHGVVLALKNGVPALAIDPISGGAKIAAQCRVLKWPLVFDVDRLDAAELERGFDWCLSAEARAQAGVCRDRGIEAVAQIGREFVAALKG